MDLNPERIAWYQDAVKSFYGRDTETYAEYHYCRCVTREKCNGKVTKKLAHLNRYDVAMCLGIIKGYMDCQSSLTCDLLCAYGRHEDLRVPLDLDKMGYNGGPLCQHIWIVNNQK